MFPPSATVPFIITFPLIVPPELENAPKFVLAFAAVVAPVPPFATGNVPVTPGVIFAVPSKLVLLVLAKFVRIVLAVCNFVAVAAFPVVFPVPPLAIGNVPLVTSPAECLCSVSAFLFSISSIAATVASAISLILFAV